MKLVRIAVFALAALAVVACERLVGVEALDRHLPLATEPTLGVLAGGALVYVANSPWASYGDDGQPLAGAAWPRPTLLRLPLSTQ
mgnify:CR=1 FL=1